MTFGIDIYVDDIGLVSSDIGKQRPGRTAGGTKSRRELDQSSARAKFDPDLRWGQPQRLRFWGFFSHDAATGTSIPEAIGSGDCKHEGEWSESSHMSILSLLWHAFYF